MRGLVAALILMAGPLQAQDQTLADIRQELSVLYVEVQRLNRELSTTGSASGVIGGDTLQRVDLIAREVQRLTAKTEELEFRISRVVKDGTNRIGDLEFRLCELEPACDIGSLGNTPTLGGDTPTLGGDTGTNTSSATTSTATTQPSSSEMAMGEQADFDRAVAAMDSGDYGAAAAQFVTFTDTYIGGPLSSEAHFLRGDALSNLGKTSEAARAYLQSFSGTPNGPRAADALLRLGESLADLGQNNEACVTLGEVGARFPGASQVSMAEAKRVNLGC